MYFAHFNAVFLSKSVGSSSIASLKFSSIYSSIVLIIIIIGEISKKRKERERENKKEDNK